MITKLHLINWKSFKDSIVYIDPLTFLIGTNASGKSNVLDAFLFMHLLLKGQSLEEAAAAIRGGEDWIIRKGETWFKLAVTIEKGNLEYEYVIHVNKDEVGNFLAGLDTMNQFRFNNPKRKDLFLTVVQH